MTQGIGYTLKPGSIPAGRGRIVRGVSVVISVVTIIACTVGVFFIGVAALAATRHLPGNSFVGVRTPETRKSPEAFAVANKAAAPGIFLAGLTLIGGTAAALALDSLLGFLAGGVALVFAVFLLGLAGLNGARIAAVWASVAEQAGPSQGCDRGCGCGDDDKIDSPESSSLSDLAEDGSPAQDCGVRTGCASCSLEGFCAPPSAAK